MRIYLHFYRNERRCRRNERKKCIDIYRKDGASGRARTPNNLDKHIRNEKLEFHHLKQTVCLMLSMTVNDKVCHLSSSILKCLSYA